MPIAPVSPSPLTPMASSVRLASTAPVPTDGMRPCTVLKPCAEPRKYAGLLLEQPMPESLMTPRGSTPISKNASMIRSEIALCPQPAHSVVLPPRYGAISRPMRLIFLPGSGVAVVVIRTLAARSAIGRRHQGVGVTRALQTFLLLDGVGHRAGVDRQAAVVQHAAQTGDPLGRAIEPHQPEHLRVTILLDDVDPRVAVEKLVELGRERVGAQPQIARPQAELAVELGTALIDREVARAITDDADFCLRLVPDIRLRDVLPRRLELAPQAV